MSSGRTNGGTASRGVGSGMAGERSVEMHGHHFDVAPMGARCRWCGLTLTGKLDLAAPTPLVSATPLVPCEPLAL